MRKLKLEKKNDVSSFYDDDSEYIYLLLSKSMEIKIKENEYIVISLGSGCNYDIGKNGREGFDLDYEISDSKKRCMINIDLCEEMINELSCRSIRKRFLKDFINAPESKYPKTKYGSEKVKKYYTYDFWGNTDLYYVVKPSMIDKSEDEKILSYTSYLKDVW